MQKSPNEIGRGSERKKTEGYFFGGAGEAKTAIVEAGWETHISQMIGRAWGENPIRLRGPNLQWGHR
jgi:hypothetical protein